MAKKKCIPNNPIAQDASIEATKQVLEIKASYNATFGAPINQVPILKGSLKSVVDKLAIERLKLKTALRKKTKQVPKHKKQVQKLTDEAKDLKIQLKEAPQKFKLLSQLEDMLVNNLISWADKNAYDINPGVYFPIITDFLLERFGFIPNADTTIPDLRAVIKTLNRILKAQKSRDDKPISTLKRQMQDPGILMLKQDPTGLAFDLVNKTREAPAEIFGISNKYKNKIKVASDGFLNWIRVNKYLFNVNIPSNGVIGSKELGESSEKLIEFAFDVMDGRAKYIIPKPIGGDKVENADFLKDQDDYNKIVRRNIFDQINEGGEIQKLTTPQGQTFYYVTIKQEIDSHDGKEVYYAYEVPFVPGSDQEGKASNDFLLLPRSSKKGVKGDIARKKYDDTLGEDSRLATYTNKTGKKMQGRMAEGWYQANTYVPLQGIKKKVKYGQEVEVPFNVFSYSNYRHNDNINNTNDPNSPEEIPHSFWELIDSLRTTLAAFLNFARDKNTTTENIRQDMVKKLRNQSGHLNTEQFDQMMTELLSIDGIRSNITQDHNGNLITSNTAFGELYNYIPWRYIITEIYGADIKGRDALIAKIENLTNEIKVLSSKEPETVQESLDNTSKITVARLELEEAEGIVDHLNDKVLQMEGKKDNHEIQRLNQVQTVAAAQHRKGFINPFPTYDEDGNKLTHGRLATIDVIGTYIEETARSLVNNDTTNDLMNVVSEASEAVSEFMIDHVKASFGRIDIEAGMLGLDYSNPTVVKKLNKFMQNFRGPDYEMTDQDLQSMSKMHSMLISGNLLQLGSTLNNHFQRISVWIECVENDWKAAEMIYNGKNPQTGNQYADEIAEASGVTEVTIGLADSLMGSMSDELTMGVGWLSKQDLAILQLSKRKSLDAMKKNKNWRKFYKALIKRRAGEVKGTAEQLLHLYDGTWELVNGIEKGTLTKGQLEGIKKQLEGIVQADIVNAYASWGLKGGYASGAFKRTGLDKFMTFSGVEVEMRKWTAVQYAVQAVNSGMVPIEVINNPKAFGFNSEYEHPNALKMARIGCNCTMFGLSPQFLNQAFRGGTGALLWKFKPYQWHQGRREIVLILNYWNSLSSEKKSEAIRDTMLMFAPPMFGIGPYLNQKVTGKKNISNIHSKTQMFLWTRVLASLVLTPSFFIPGLTSVQRWLRKQTRFNQAYGAGYTAMERGGTSVIMNSILMLIGSMSLITGFIDPVDDEEEKKIYSETSRWFMPLYLNMAIEGIINRNPANAIRAYSQSAYRMGTWARDLFNHATGGNDEED